MAETAYIALGSNLGDRARTIGRAIARIGALTGCDVIAEGPVIETDPVGPGGAGGGGGAGDQGRYLNTTIAVWTTLDARALLDALLAIEHDLGRDRAVAGRWGPRTIDLDILLYGDRVIDEPGLRIPHPRMHQRAFVLEPLAAIAAGVRHPELGTPVGDLLAALGDAPHPP